MSSIAVGLEAIATFFKAAWDFNTTLSFIVFFLIIHFGLSGCLLRFPNWYANERRKRQKRLQTPLRNVRVIGHRGCVPDELDGKEVFMNITENTLGAFSHAISGSLKADCIELDVQLSRDEQVVVLHNSKFSDGRYVMETNYCDFPLTGDSVGTLQSRARRDNKRGASLDVAQSRVPLFSEVLELLNKPGNEDICLMVEVKAYGPRGGNSAMKDRHIDKLIIKTHELLVRYGRVQAMAGSPTGTQSSPQESGQQRTTTLWFSLDERTNRKLRRCDPNIVNQNSVTETLKLLAAYHLGLLPYFTPAVDIFGTIAMNVDLELIHTLTSTRTGIHTWPAWVHRLLLLILSGKPSLALLNAKLHRHLNMRGIPVWALIKPAGEGENMLNVLRQRHVQGVVCNRPKWVARLEANNK